MLVERGPKPWLPSTLRCVQVDSPYAEHTAGFEQWLIKLDGVSGTGMDGHGDDLGEPRGYGSIEYAYSLMAGTAGIDMMPCKLLAEGPRHHFMTKRFDRREGGERLHVISLSALAHLDYNLVGAHSYDQYLQSVKALGLSNDELAEAYRRMVFNVMAVNNDDHAKNFSFLRSADSGWHLSPAFDLVHAYNPNNEWIARHLMSVDGKFEGIGLEDLYAVGERNDVPGYRRVVPRSPRRRRRLGRLRRGGRGRRRNHQTHRGGHRALRASLTMLEQRTELREGLEPRPSQVGTRKRGPNRRCFE